MQLFSARDTILLSIELASFLEEEEMCQIIWFDFALLHINAYCVSKFEQCDNFILFLLESIAFSALTLFIWYQQELMLWKKLSEGYVSK